MRKRPAGRAAYWPPRAWLQKRHAGEDARVFLLRLATTTIFLFQRPASAPPHAIPNGIVNPSERFSVILARTTQSSAVRPSSLALRSFHLACVYLHCATPTRSIAGILPGPAFFCRSCNMPLPSKPRRDESGCQPCPSASHVCSTAQRCMVPLSTPSGQPKMRFRPRPALGRRAGRLSPTRTPICLSM